MLAELCNHEPELMARMRAKQPSSGMLALAIGLKWFDFERHVLSGFSFEITHAYADNPLIAERGSASSKHAETDIELLRHLEGSGPSYTTEPTVHQRAGIPLLEARPRSGQEAARAERHTHEALKRLSNISKYGLGAQGRERKQADKEQRRQQRFTTPICGSTAKTARAAGTARTRSISSTRHPSSTRSCLGCTRKADEDFAEFRRRFASCAALDGARVCSALARGSAPKCARSSACWSMSI